MPRGGGGAGGGRRSARGWRRPRSQRCCRPRPRVPTSSSECLKLWCNTQPPPSPWVPASPTAAGAMTASSGPASAMMLCTRCAMRSTTWNTTCPRRTRGGLHGRSTLTMFQRPWWGVARAAAARWSTARRACWPTTAAASGACCPNLSPGCPTPATSARAGAARSRMTARSTSA